MTEGFALALAGVGFVLGMLGYSIRRQFPRGAMFLMALMVCGIGLWGVVSTLELAKKGQAHTFSRHYSTFSAAAAPGAFEWSYWFHLALGALLLIVGVAALVFPFTRRGRRITFK